MKRLLIYHLCVFLSFVCLAGTVDAGAKIQFNATHLVKNKKDGQLIAKNAKQPKMKMSDVKARTGLKRIITERPQGELKTYIRSGQAIYVSGGLYSGEQSGKCYIVYGDEGKVYLQNILYGCGDYFGISWVEGTIEGNVITVPLGQSIHWSDDYQADVVLGWGSTKIYYDGYEYVSYTLDESITEVQYIVDGDHITGPVGTAPVEDPDNFYWSYEATGLSCYWTDDNSFGGFMEWNTVLTEDNSFNPPSIISEIPEGCEVYKYNRNSASIYSSWFGINNVLTDGEFMIAFDQSNGDAYIKNPLWYHNILDTWVKGSYDRTTGIISIPTGQYLSWDYANEYGIVFGWGSTYVYTDVDEYGEEGYYMGTEIDVNTTEIQLKIDGDKVYLLNCEGDFNAEFPENFNATGMMSYWSDDQSMTSIEFSKRDQSGEAEPFGFIKAQAVPVIPANPTADDWYDCGDESGYSKFYFTLPTKDADGNMLVPKYLSYSIFIDNGNGPELFTFLAEDYIYDLTSDITEVPYEIYSNSYYFRNNCVRFFRTNAAGYEPLFTEDNIGIQVYYTVNGVRNASEIVWLPPRVDPPTASIPSGSTVMPRTELHLSAQGNPILYAIDYTGNTSDLEWNSYDDNQPIIINSDIKVYAYATKPGYRHSQTAAFTYHVEDNYPLLKNASFTVDKTNILIDNYLTFRVQFELNDEYVHKVSDLELFLILPPSCPLNVNSVMVGNFISNYFFESNGFVIPLLDDSEIIRFCATPSVPGDQSAFAYVQCKHNGVTRRSLIGKVQFCAIEMTLNVPPLTANPTFMVSGSATKGKSAKVYIDGVEVAQTECLENGSWRVPCSLNQPANPSTHRVYAIVTTTDGYDFRTDTKEVLYRMNAPQPDRITMRNVVFDFLNGTTTPWCYSYNPSQPEFTFVAKLKGTTTSVRNLKIKILDTSGEVKTFDGVYSASLDGWVCTAYYGNTNKLPTSVGVAYDYVLEGETEHYETVFTNNTNGVTPNAIPIIDPSGYVYEAVPSNRLEGVTATCYYKDSETGEPVLWDATQYEQENPLLTDEQGFYRWDVPIGIWQVKYEKEGYQTVYSEWLPVPPPQLDVNIAMTEMRQPEVIKAHAYPNAVELEFNKYMKPETLTTGNITVSVNGTPVNGTIQLLNEETGSGGQSFATRVRFNANQPFNASQVTLRVNHTVETYAGLQMNEDYVKVLDVETEMTKIVTDAAIDVAWGKDYNLIVAVQPADAAKGKTLTVRSASPMIVSTSAETYTLDENGQAVVSVHGDLPGMGTLLFGIEDYDLTASTLVNVSIETDNGLRGDVNGDGEVNVADINTLIDIILGGRVDEDTRIRADVNGDGEVNIADVNAVIDIILNPAGSKTAVVNCDDLLHIDDMTMKPGDVRTLSVTLDNAASYSAMQCDIVLPAGLTLVDVMPDNGHMSTNDMMSDRTSRALTYSMSKNPFVGSQPVLTFTVQADAALDPESEITLTNVVLADTDNRAWHIGDCTARVNNASGIKDMTACADRVWFEGHTLCIETTHDGMACIANVSGMTHNVDVAAGINHYVLEPGFYVVVLNGHSYKIAVK